MGRVRHSRRYVAGSSENVRTIRTLGAEGTERSGAHNCHNHPSGVAEPSQSDQLLTETLKRALDLVDVKVLDHFIVTCGAAMSFSEHGLI